MRENIARSSCSEIPGGGAFNRSCSRKPAMRISKNSSRLLLTMHRKRRRSRSGVADSSASVSTRRLKASIDNSRLIAGGSGSLAEAGLGAEAVEVTVEEEAGEAETVSVPRMTIMLRSLGRDQRAAAFFEREPYAAFIRFAGDRREVLEVRCELLD